MLPNGERRWLVLIKDWDIDRQSVYRFAKPVSLPSGSVVHMRYTYDNSARNVRNPNSPPVRVHAGNRSVDEMGHLWLQVLPRADKNSAGVDPRMQLERVWMENRLRKNEKDDIALYNLASLTMMEGDGAQAVKLYRRVLERRPDDVRTITSLGTAMEASGDWQQAQAQYRAAMAKDPSYVDAVFDLATLDLRHGSVAEAEPLLLRAIAGRNDGEAQRLLAMVYAGMGRMEKAVEHLLAWQKLQPIEAEPHRALAQLYSQMGRMQDAIREQKTVVTLVQGLADDWNDLGVMEAQAGDKAAARRDLEHALQLEPGNKAAQANLRRL